MPSFSRARPARGGFTLIELLVLVTLVPDGVKDYTSRPARAEPDGSFEITDVPAGKYRIAVEQHDPNPQTDKLGGTFSVAKTTIVRQIDGKAPLVIDLDKPGE